MNRGPTQMPHKVLVTIDDIDQPRVSLNNRQTSISTTSKTERSTENYLRFYGYPTLGLVYDGVPVRQKCSVTNVYI